MNESSTSWIAILTLKSDPSTSNIKGDAEPYILSQEEPTFIGRSNDCQITLKPKYSTASRYHAKVESLNLNGQLVWQVCDLETPNGSYVNNQKIKNCQPLNPGDQLVLGKPNGAAFTFEWKEIEIVKLNDIFRKKHSYDETYVPGAESFILPEEKTHASPGSSDSPPEYYKDSANLPEDHPILSESPEPVSPEPVSPKASPQSNRSLALAKTFLGLLLVSGILFLLYRIPETFQAQKTKDDSLSSYVDNISRLLIDTKLESLDPFDPSARKARESANGQTISTLKNIDGQHKGALLRFLHGAKLIRLLPQQLSRQWISSPNLISKEKVQLSPQLLDRQELLLVNHFTVPKNPVERAVLAVMQTQRAQELSPSAVKKCGVQVQSETPSCGWLLTFNSLAYEQPFYTPIQLSGADLTGVVLRDAPLEGINLEGAYLSFQQCKQTFTGNFFVDTFYRRPQSWFSNSCSADLSGSGFQNGRFFRSVLPGANLSNAKLDFADLRQADLRAANLTGVSWHGALLNGACYLEEDWKNAFPKIGPDGKTFDPKRFGMRPIAAKASNFNDSSSFQECKSLKPPA